MERLLETVTAQNAGLVRIHTFQVSPGTRFYDQFLEQLALRNGGTYTAVR
jgi:hypothetical protein